MRKSMTARAFSRSADRYERAAELQERVAQRLLAECKVGEGPVLDAGCGTGFLLRHLPQAIGLDIAMGMCQRAHKHWLVICADMERLPFADEQFGTVVSSLAMQWLPAPEHFLHEALRVTRTEGTLHFTTFGPQTLHELRHAFRVNQLPPSVIEFPAMVDLQSMLLHCGWRVIKAEAIMEVEMEPVQDVLRRLSTIGASFRHSGGTLGLAAPLRAVIRTYQKLADRAGKVPVTWEIFQVSAVK